MTFYPNRYHREAIWLTKWLITQHVSKDRIKKELIKFNNEAHKRSSIWFSDLCKIRHASGILTFVEKYMNKILTKDELFEFNEKGWLFNKAHLEIIEDCFESFDEFEEWMNKNVIKNTFWSKKINSPKVPKLFGFRFKSYMKRTKGNKDIKYTDEYVSVEAIYMMFLIMKAIDSCFFKAKIKEINNEKANNTLELNI